MWLSDYQKAINTMIKVLGDGCYTRIVGSFDGSRVLFYKDNPDFFYVYFFVDGRIEIYYPDTWEHSEHKKVLYRGE